MRSLFNYGLAAGLLVGVTFLMVAQLALSGTVRGSTDLPDPEDELKAATVLAILQNARWSETDPGAFVTVGVLGRPAFSRMLRRYIEGRPVNGRQARVVDLTLPPDPRCCQVYYIATDRKADTRRALAGATARHILTIGETSHFLEDGGAINLFLVDGHMAFEVSMAALEECRVAISSRLLRFGRVRDAAKSRGPG